MVTASAYTPFECGNGGVASDGSKAVAGCTVAVSRDLKHLIGKTIHIEGIGKRRVNDLMHKRWKCSVDICVPNAKAANAFGRQVLKIQEVE